MLTIPPIPSRHGNVAPPRRLKSFLPSLAPIAPESTIKMARTIRQYASSSDPAPLESTPVPTPITSTVIAPSRRRWPERSGVSSVFWGAASSPFTRAPLQAMALPIAMPVASCGVGGNTNRVSRAGRPGGLAPCSASAGWSTGGGTGGGFGEVVRGIPPATAPAALPATIVRLLGAKIDTLFRTWSEPKTASTISCTLWNRLAGSFSSARRMVEANGSSMPVRSGLADRCFMRISPTLDPLNGVLPRSIS